MKKKILSLVLVVAMLASMLVLAPVSGAASDTTISISSATAKPGDTVTLDVEIQRDGDINGGQIAWEYDGSKLKYEEIEWAVKVDTGSESNKDGDGFKEFTYNGPYDVFNPLWVESTNAASGIVVARITFTVLEGASGVAEVTVCNPQRADGYKITRVYTDWTGSNYVTDVNCVAGKVMILPEEYASAEVDESLFSVDVDDNFEDGVERDCYAYEGEWGGTIVIPENPEVTAIGYRAFNSVSADTTVIVPATIKSIASQAIRRPAKDVTLTVIFLGDDTEFASGAIQNTGSYGNIVIVSAAGSTAESFVDEEGVANTTWQELNSFNLTFNGSTYFVAADAPAPGMMKTEDGLVVAWTDGTNVYAPGQPMALTANAELTAAKVIATPDTLTEVGIQLADKAEDLSMRFKASFGIADYNALAELGTVKLGMLITPARYVSKAYAFTKEALDSLGATNGAYVDIAMDGYFSKTATDYIFAGRLANFSSATLAKNPNFVAVLYATVETADGTVFTVYGDYDHATIRNVKSVAEAVSTDGLSNPIKNALAGLIESFQ